MTAIALRDAVANEAEALSQLAMRSKAHWEYDEAFLEACRDELTVTPAMIAAREVRVAERDSVLQGLHRLSVAADDACIELLYVDPATIGSGVGRRLWDDLVARARRLLIEADPHTEGFYRRMGAVRAGSCPSGSIPGRMLPLLALDLSDNA